MHFLDTLMKTNISYSPNYCILMIGSKNSHAINFLSTEFFVTLVFHETTELLYITKIYVYILAYHTLDI
jgi:hypothetical protein